MDIDTLTFVPLYCCIISIEKKERVVTENWKEEPMYKSFELIYEALNQIHGVMMFTVYIC
jgi:hypothetical protein